MKRIIALFLGMIIGISLLTGCQKEINQLDEPIKGDTIAEIVVKNYGTIYVRLLVEGAPKAVENFTTLAKEGYYNGLSVYRIIEDSLIECGDPTGTGNDGESIWGENFKDEFNSNLQPYYGALCMANAGPDTNSSRFFVVQTNHTYTDEVLDQIEQTYNIDFNENVRELYGKIGGAPWFYRKNTVFGQVYKGYDVLNKIAKVEKTDEELGVPAEEVVIEKVNIIILE